MLTTAALLVHITIGAPAAADSAPFGPDREAREAAADAAKIRQAMRSMEGRPAESRQAFAGAALAELTPGRLVEPLRKAFADLQTAPGPMRRLTFMKAFATPEGAASFARVCAAGPRALANMARLPVAEQSRHLWTECKFTGSGLITAAEAEKTEALALAAAMVAAAEVGKAELEREVLQFFLKASPVPTQP
jgi:hypothetical protein